MENITKFEISRSLGFQIRKYKESEYNKPILLLSLREDLSDKITENQFVAFSVYNTEKKDQMRETIPRDFEIRGVLVFQKHQFPKVKEIMEIFDTVNQGFWYNDDDDEFFQLKISGDSNKKLYLTTLI